MLKHIITTAIFLLYAFAATAENNFYKILVDVNPQWHYHQNLANSIDANTPLPVTEVDKIKCHLQMVINTLSAASTAQLNTAQVANRTHCLSLLQAYCNKGVFPQNTFHAKRTPYFIDMHHTPCAVGHLIIETGEEALAKQINTENNYGYLKDLAKLYDGIGVWADVNGFSVDELAWIQPTYGGLPTQVNIEFSDTTIFKGIACNNSYLGGFILDSIDYAYIKKPGYKYSISPGAPYTVLNSDDSLLPMGTYTVIVNDCYNDYVTFLSINIQREEPLTLTTHATATICGSAGAYVIDSIYGGVGPYSVLRGSQVYNYTNSPITISNTPNSSEFITVIDSANMCVQYEQISALKPSIDSFSYIEVIPGLCFEDSTTLQLKFYYGAYIDTDTIKIKYGYYFGTKVDSGGCNYYYDIRLGYDKIVRPTKQISPSIYCVGDTVTVTYVDDNSLLPLTGISTFVEVVSASPTAYTAYTVSNSLGCSTTAYHQPTYIKHPLSAFAYLPNLSSNVMCSYDTTTITVIAHSGWNYCSNPEFVGDTILYGVTPGTYTFTVADIAGCTSSTSITISVAPSYTISALVQPILCGGDTASISFSAAGGTAPFTNLNTIIKPAGNYTHTVSDAYGCSRTLTYINQGPFSGVYGNIASTISPLCNGQAGTVNINATGYDAPFSGIGSFANIAGTHTHVVTSASGCADTISYTINQPSAVVVNAIINGPICAGNSGQMVIGASGGTAPYTGTGIFTLASGVYTFNVSDNNGCVGIDTLTMPSSLSNITISNITPVYNVNTLTYDLALLFTSNLTSVHSLSLSNSSSTLWQVSNVSSQFTNVPSGIYTLTIIDSTGCQTDTVFTLVDVPSGISNTSKNTWQIIPTTSNGNFEFVGNNDLMDKKLRLYNNLGQLVYVQEIKASKQNIMLGHLPSGVYTFSVDGYCQRVVKLE
jgi:hypothetical protein